MSAPFAFTPAQADAMRAELVAMHGRTGDWFAVANALGISANTLQKFMKRQDNGAPALAFRIAMVTGKPVDEVIHGAPHGRCPTCGAALRAPLTADAGQDIDPPTLRTPRPGGEP